MDQLKSDFSETVSSVATIKDELIEEKKKVVQSNEQLVKQEVMLTEKTNQAEKYETELKDARATLGKLEEQRDTLEKELIETKTSRDLQYKELTRIQDEFSQYKKDNEDQFAFGASVRKLLDTSIEGKIILDNLAEKLNETAVKAKQSINTLRDLGIVKVDEESRNVSL
jgi:chromosome segregation ATPase